MGLRNNEIPKAIEIKEPVAPEVFFKKTALSNIRDELKQKQQKVVFNTSDYGHMIPRKLDRTPEKQTLQQLKFYTDLRKNEKFDQMYASKSNKQFDLVPYK